MQQPSELLVRRAWSRWRSAGMGEGSCPLLPLAAMQKARRQTDGALRPLSGRVLAVVVHASGFRSRQNFDVVLLTSASISFLAVSAAFAPISLRSSMTLRRPFRHCQCLAGPRPRSWRCRRLFGDLSGTLDRGVEHFASGPSAHPPALEQARPRDGSTAAASRHAASAATPSPSTTGFER